MLLLVLQTRMTSHSNKNFQFVSVGAAFLFAAALIFPNNTFAAAQTKDTFCSDLPHIEDRINEKKASMVEKLHGLQEQHSTSFAAQKDRLASFRSTVEGRKVTPDFTETKKREALRSTEAMEERREKAASYFSEQKALIEHALSNVASMHEDAFAKAYKACKEGTDPASVKEAFKEDIQMIQSHIREEGMSLKAQKEETVGSYLKNSKSTPHTLRSFFYKAPGR